MTNPQAPTRIKLEAILVLVLILSGATFLEIAFILAPWIFTLAYALFLLFSPILFILLLAYALVLRAEVRSLRKRFENREDEVGVAQEG